MTEDEPIPRLSDTLVPVSVTGAGVLTKQAFDGADLGALLEDYKGRTNDTREDAGLLLDISIIFQLAFQHGVALELQSQALDLEQLYRVRGTGRSTTSGGRPSLRLLALVGPGDLMVNTPLEFILEGSAVRLDLLYVRPGEPLPAEVPDHDVAFMAVSEPDENRELLLRLCRIVERWPRPVINDPRRILDLSREQVYATLEGLPGVTVPATLRLSREELGRLADGREAEVGRGLSYPLVVRPVGSHAGSELEKVDDAEALERYLASASAAEYYLMPFIDYRASDGLFRKYRIVLIERKPYLCHMGVSEHWMIHYLNAGMRESEAKRQKETEAMATFDEGFALRHREALEGLCDRFGLDYFGIDCSEGPDGTLLVFEADVAMIIHDMDPPDLFPYKHPQMMKVFRAFERMLTTAASRK